MVPYFEECCNTNREKEQNRSNPQRQILQKVRALNPRDRPISLAQAPLDILIPLPRRHYQIALAKELSIRELHRLMRFNAHSLNVRELI